jgi:vacuolar-type H+-ATPase subunit E/Vma4
MSKTNVKNNQIVEVDEGKAALIGGITGEARKEAEEIASQAEKAKEERILARNNQVKAILDDAKAKAKAQVETIKRNTQALISVDSKRKILKLREDIINRVMDEVSSRMEGLVSSPEYGGMLKSWIVEAVMGLSSDACSINSSEKEKPMITASLLSEAETEIERLCGSRVKLSLTDDPPVSGLGVTATSSDGRTAFNNQVQTRLMRRESEIRKLIYHELFGE